MNSSHPTVAPPSPQPDLERGRWGVVQKKLEVSGSPAVTQCPQTVSLFPVTQQDAWGSHGSPDAPQPTLCCHHSLCLGLGCGGSACPWLFWGQAWTPQVVRGLPGTGREGRTSSAIMSQGMRPQRRGPSSGSRASRVSLPQHHACRSGSVHFHSRAATGHYPLCPQCPP